MFESAITDAVVDNHLIGCVATMVANGEHIDTICDSVYMTESELRSYPDINIMLGNQHVTDRMWL